MVISLDVSMAVCKMQIPGWPDGRWVMGQMTSSDAMGILGTIARAQSEPPKSEMRADLMALAAELNEAQKHTLAAIGWSQQIRDDLDRPTSPLPAPALTEDAIVAALKADPAMAGRVMATLAFKWPPIRLPEVSDAAKAWSLETGGDASVRRAAIQSLVVALAAASYRG